MTIKEILNNAIEKLKEKNIEEPISKAKLVLAYTLGISKEQIIVEYNTTIEKDKETIFLEYIGKVADGEPVQYITKSVEFMKLKFYVDERVLIPRADTEILVEQVIKYAEAVSNTTRTR